MTWTKEDYVMGTIMVAGAFLGGWFWGRRMPPEAIQRVPATAMPSGPQRSPGTLYQGENPGPWDQFGISTSHEQLAWTIDESAYGDQTEGWSLYRNSSTGELFGVASTLRSGGWRNSVFTGLPNVEDAISTIERWYNTNKIQ